MTVSRALRGQPGISASTRKRIAELAKKMGYRPDPVVSRLMSRLRGSRISGAEPLAYITSFPTHSEWRNNAAYLSLFQGATERANLLGYKLEEFWLGGAGMTGARLSKILRHRGIRGVIVAPLPSPGTFLGFQWEHFASVCCGYSLTEPPLHRVASNQFQGLKLAYEALAGFGYSRIGFALPAYFDLRVNHLWQGSYSVAQSQLPRKNRISPWIPEGWTRKKFLNWFAKIRPDALISSREAHEWLTAAGISIPSDCGFADINGMESHLAGVEHHLADVGTAAIDVVAGGLAANEIGVPKVSRTVQVDCSWRNGPTARSQ